MKFANSNGLSIGKACCALGYARSSYYKSLTVSEQRKEEHVKVLNQVREIRKIMPKLGTRKLHKILRKTLFQSGHTSLGRDRLFDLLRENDLLVTRKAKYAVTTNSNHPFKVHKNLILKKSINRPNQVWVSDITYIRLRDGFAYASLITDHYSKKIVGYHLNDTLELEGCVKALNQALKYGKPEIHHSDRGSQYCSYAYTKILKKKKVKISMTQDGNCYENAVAERLNGILKDEFNLNATFKSVNDARKALKQAVDVYNTLRPHWSLNLQVPDEVHLAA